MTSLYSSCPKNCSTVVNILIIVFSKTNFILEKYILSTPPNQRKSITRYIDAGIPNFLLFSVVFLVFYVMNNVHCVTMGPSVTDTFIFFNVNTLRQIKKKISDHFYRISTFKMQELMSSEKNGIYCIVLENVLLL